MTMGVGSISSGLSRVLRRREEEEEEDELIRGRKGQ